MLAGAHAAFDLAERWAKSGQTPLFNIAVVNWFNEEGSRFVPSMMGSSVFSGGLPLEVALATTDSAGVSVAEALDKAGFLADVDVLDEANRLLAEHVEVIEQTASVTIAQQLSHEWGINPYQPAGVELARQAVEELDYPYEEILTVAGHDSVNMKERVPTVMLFVPSVEGVSHNEADFTRDQDLLAGLDVLTNVVGQLAFGALIRSTT